MADTALFIGWGEVVRGRETKAAGLFEEVVQYFGKLQQDGRVEAFEPWFLERHGGDLNGFFLLRGSAARIDELRRDPDFEKLITRISLIVENIGITHAYTGADLQRLLGAYQESAADVAG